ncbi:MAG TPA: hypothetical protein V6D23_00390 [Candidatus Obscuribacterales bacterium]
MLSLLFILACLLSGLLLLGGLGIPLRYHERLPAGLLTGLVLCLLSVYAVCLLEQRLSLNGILTGTGLILCLGIWLNLKGGLSPVLRPKPDPELRPLAWLLAGWTLVLVPVFQHLIILDAQGAISAVTTDLAVHVAMVEHFALGGSFPPQNPLFAGEPLVYPFFINFLSAIGVRLGLTLPLAMIAPGVLLSLLLLSLLYALTLRFTASRPAALLAPAVLLCSGGLGLLWFLYELSGRGFNPLMLLALPGHNYTERADIGIEFFNLLRFFLLPQRSLLLGLPLALLVLLLIHIAQTPDPQAPPAKTSSLTTWLLAGLLAGCMPLMHTHSFMALGLTLPLATLLNRQRGWWIFWSALGLAALPQLLWILGGLGDSHFLFRPIAGGWHGWSANTPVVLFWFLNAGVMLGLLAWGLASKSTPADLRRWTLISFVLFILPNCFLFAPFAGDNMKLFVLWYSFSVPLASLMLIRLFRRSRLLGTAVLLLLLGAGTLDILKLILFNSNTYALISRKELQLADATGALFPAATVFIHAPVHYHFWYFTGQVSLLATAGFAASYGLSPGEREQDLRTLYSSKNCNLVRQMLLHKYPMVRAAIWGPLERGYFQIESTCLSQLFPVVYTHYGYEIYRIGSPQAGEN